MRLLPLILIAGVANAATLNEELRAIAVGADRVELTWRQELGVGAFGIGPLKKVYSGPEIGVLLSRVAFVDDLPREAEPPLPPGTIVAPLGNCLCAGSHLLRFWSGNRVLAEVSFHHGTHLRSKRLNGGRDAVLTDDAQKWLQAESDWSADARRIEEYEHHKKPNQAPEPTTTLVTPRADARVAPSMVVAHL